MKALNICFDATDTILHLNDYAHIHGGHLLWFRVDAYSDVSGCVRSEYVCVYLNEKEYTKSMQNVMRYRSVVELRVYEHSKFYYLTHRHDEPMSVIGVPVSVQEIVQVSGLLSYYKTYYLI